MPSANGPAAKWKQITPALAAEWLEDAAPNRKLSKNRIALMIHDIKAGSWKENGEPIILSDKGRLLDGQHRCHAVVGADKAITSLVVEDIKESVFESLNQGKTRTSHDVLGMEGVPNANHAAGVARMLWQFESFGMVSLYSIPPRSEIIRVYKSASEEIQDGLSIGSEVQHATKCPRAGAAIAWILIRRHASAKKAVDRFFAQIAGDDPDVPSPISALQRFFENRNPRRGGLWAYQTVPLFIKAWNAVRKDQAMQVVTYRKGESFPDIEK